MMKHLFFASVVSLIAFAALPVLAREIHVSPKAAPGGDGSLGRPLDVFTALGANSPAKPGDTILLADGRYDGKMKGIERVPFEWAVSGTRGKPVVIRPAGGASVHLNGTARLTSSHAHYIGLEVGDLKWDPYQNTHKSATALWAVGGEGAMVINCNLFGGRMGTGLWSPAKNLTLYGCLVHDFGYLEAAGRGHGHAFYAQNETGTKRIEQNIAWRGCGWNLHVYTQGGQINGFDAIDNIMYIAGAYRPGQTMDNYLVAGYPAADRIRLIGNVGYQPSDVQRFRPNARLSHYKPVRNGTAVVKDNYFAGAFYGLSLGDWQDVTVTGNTIWASGYFMEISSSPTGVANGRQNERPSLTNYKIDRNTYFENGRQSVFVYGRQERPDDDETLTWTEWQRLGLDRNGKLLPGRNGKPAGMKVIVFANRFDKGRGHVAVFNWDGNDTVNVDLSPVLAEGRKFAIYNCLDIKQTITRAKPVVTGAYDGKPVRVPLRKDAISPAFDALLVLPTGP